MSYTYNAAGDLLSLTDGRGRGTTWTFATTSGFDAAGRMNSVVNAL